MKVRVKLFKIFLTLTIVIIASMFSSMKLEAKSKSNRLISRGMSAQSYTINPFEQLSISGTMNVFIKQGEKYHLQVEGNESDLENIEVRQTDNALYVGIKKKPGFTFISKKVDVFISTPTISEITLNGSVNVATENEFHVDLLKITSNGSGNANLNLNTKDLEVNIKGSSTVLLSGYTQNQNVNVAGSGSYKANKLLSGSANINIFGSGTAYLDVERELNVKAFGSGNVIYKGNPTVQSQTYGSGRVKAI